MFKNWRWSLWAEKDKSMGWYWTKQWSLTIFSINKKDSNCKGSYHLKDKLFSLGLYDGCSYHGFSFFWNTSQLPVALYIAFKSAVPLIVINFLLAFRQLFTAYNNSITWLFCPIFEIYDEPTWLRSYWKWQMNWTRITICQFKIQGTK